MGAEEEDARALEQAEPLRNDPTEWTQSEWSTHWFDHVCRRRGIPDHDERVKLLLVDLEEKLRWVEGDLRRLDRASLWQRLWWIWTGRRPIGYQVHSGQGRWGARERASEVLADRVGARP